MVLALILGVVVFAIFSVFIAVHIGRWVGMATAEQYQKRFQYEKELRKSAEKSFHELIQTIGRDLKSLCHDVEDRHHDIPYREVHGDQTRFMIPHFDKVDVRRVERDYREIASDGRTEHGEFHDYALRFRVFIPKGQHSKTCSDAALLTQGARLFRDAIVKESERLGRDAMKQEPEGAEDRTIGPPGGEAGEGGD